MVDVDSSTGLTTRTPDVSDGRGARIVALDVARGVAILGTLATNIWIFSHPGGMIGHLADPISPGVLGAQAFAEQLLMQLANGKFLGLLMLMFGVGLAIQAESAARAGRAWPGPYLWRAAILFLDGLLHYVLVVEFDVLMGYAVTGAIVAYVITRTKQAQGIWFGVAVTIHVLLVAMITWSLWWVGNEMMGPLRGAEVYRTGSWWDLVLLRLDNGMLLRFEPVFLLFAGTAMFLLGHWLYQGGAFAPSGRPLRRKLMALGGVALVADVALGLSNPAWLFVTRYGTAFCASLGLLAALVEYANGEWWWQRRAAEIGRVALSAYVLQNIIASVLFYGWGLDLGGMAPQLRLPVTVLAWVGISAMVALFAHAWLRRFPRGPLESVWKWLAPSARELGERGHPALPVGRTARLHS